MTVEVTLFDEEFEIVGTRRLREPVPDVIEIPVFLPLPTRIEDPIEYPSILVDRYRCWGSPGSNLYVRVRKADRPPDRLPPDG